VREELAAAQATLSAAPSESGERDVVRLRAQLATARGQLDKAAEEAERKQLELASSLAEERATAERLRKELEAIRSSRESAERSRTASKATPVPLAAARSRPPTATPSDPAARRRRPPPPRHRPVAHHRAGAVPPAEHRAPWPVRIAFSVATVVLLGVLIVIVDRIS
jgi:hypothetical protein